MKIILGSKSLGRKKMLEEMGWEFEVLVSDVDEKAIRLEDPKELTLALARAKAEALKPLISEPAILITSDCLVVCNNEILEKPESAEEAGRFLRLYNDFPAEVVTSVVVVNLATGKQSETVDVSWVDFNPYSEADIEAIIADGRVFHISGGFTLDGPLWEKHIKEIRGTRDSVIGLPKELTAKLVREVQE
jgi:septum formation protein